MVALLVVLGVDLIIVVAFAALVFGRRQWLKRQPGEFAGAIGVSSGDVDGLSPKWKRGAGSWVRDVLVWNEAPLMLTNPAGSGRPDLGGASGERRRVKRLGDKPIIIEFVADGADIEVAAKPEQRPRVTGLFKKATKPALRLPSERPPSTTIK